MCQQSASRLSRKNPKSSSSKDCEEETAAALSAYSEHLAKARQERSVYTAVCESSKRTLSVGEKLGHHNMCSRNKTMHYSFDFAQQVFFPSNPLQPGPIYFKILRMKLVMLGRGQTVLFLCCIIFFVENYGLGEEQVHFHADNCSGQNKNSCMIMYLM